MNQPPLLRPSIWVTCAAAAMVSIVIGGCRETTSESVRSTSVNLERAAKIGRDGDGKITAIDFREREFDSATIAALGKHATIKVIKFNGESGGALTSDDMAVIGRLPRLKVLAIDGVSMNDGQLNQLRNASNLVEFYASNCQLDDDVHNVLGTMSSLRKLRLSNNPIADQTIGVIAASDSLTQLDLSGCPMLEDSMFATVSLPTTLTKLNLYDTSVSDQTVRTIADLPSLTWLNLDKTNISDNAAKSLAGAKGIKWLHLGSTAIGDDAVNDLVSIRSLETLIVTRTHMTQQGVDILRQRLPEVDIQFQYKGQSSDG